MLLFWQRLISHALEIERIESSLLKLVNVQIPPSQSNGTRFASRDKKIMVHFTSLFDCCANRSPSALFSLSGLCIHFIRRPFDNLSSFRHTIEFDDDDGDEYARSNQTYHQFSSVASWSNAKCETEWIKNRMRNYANHRWCSSDYRMMEIWQQPEQQQQQHQFALCNIPTIFTVLSRPAAYSIHSFFYSHRTACIDNTNRTDWVDKAGLSKQNNSIEIWIHVSLIRFHLI